MHRSSLVSALPQLEKSVPVLEGCELCVASSRALGLGQPEETRRFAGGRDGRVAASLGRSRGRRPKFMTATARAAFRAHVGMKGLGVVMAVSLAGVAAGGYTRRPVPAVRYKVNWISRT